MNFVMTVILGRTWNGRPSGGFLEQVRQRKINCIIVKDMSRFGRDYIVVGDYLEQIFPFLDVRFIAINDSYDSRDHKYGSAGLIDVSFRNVIYDLYSKRLIGKK